VVVMDVRELSTVTDFFVIGTAASPPQLHALSDHVDATLDRYGHAVWHVEGMAPHARKGARTDQDLQWVLMDCGDCVVHLMNADARALYQLERLWADAPRVAVTERLPQPDASSR